MGKNVFITRCESGKNKKLIDKYYGAVDIAPTNVKILEIKIPE